MHIRTGLSPGALGLNEALSRKFVCPVDSPTMQTNRTGVDKKVQVATDSWSSATSIVTAPCMSLRTVN